MPNMNLWICTLTIAYKKLQDSVQQTSKNHPSRIMELEKHQLQRIIKDMQMMVVYGGNDITDVHGLSGFLYAKAPESPPQMPKAKKNPSTKIININTECFRIFQTDVRFILKHSGLFTNLT